MSESPICRSCLETSNHIEADNSRICFHAVLVEWGLPHEGVEVNKFVSPSKLFHGDIPGILLGISVGVRKLMLKKGVLIYRPIQTQKNTTFWREFQSSGLQKSLFFGRPRGYLSDIATARRLRHFGGAQTAKPLLFWVE